MRVLIACEESQEVCKAFRERGHEAYSCDIQPCSGGHPEYHLQVDALELLKMKWDLSKTGSDYPALAIRTWRSKNDLPMVKRFTAINAY